MVKSLKAKIFLVEMNWKYVINVCQGVIDKSLMYVFDFEGRIKNTSILVIVCYYYYFWGLLNEGLILFWNYVRKRGIS